MTNFDKVDDYVVVKNFLPKKFCKDYIKKITKLKWNKHTWAQYGASDKPYSRDKEELDSMTTHGELHALLSPYILKAITNYQSTFVTSKSTQNSVPIEQYSTPQLNRYFKGQGMAEHQDHISSLFVNHEGIPVLSLVGVFNDNYKGGDFVLRNKKIHLKTGDILMFPSLFIYPHEVTVVTEGVRHSFVSWAY